MIEVEQLSKQFVVRRGRFRRERVIVDAVKDISFRVERGELLGYLGPNGAGKSTTIKMLTGLLGPPSGDVPAAGHAGCGWCGEGRPWRWSATASPRP